MIAERVLTSGDFAWHALDQCQVENALSTSADGLSSDEARRRLDEHGPNELQEETGPSDFTILLGQLRSPLVMILLVAGAVTLALEEYADTIVIAAVVVLNSAVGFVQERQAERSVRALLQLVTPRARVVRDHHDLEIESRDVVPGDVVLLDSGGRIPADIRLIATTALQVDESTLTGESVPVFKESDPLPQNLVLADRTNMAFAGTIVTSGRGRGFVVGTGRETELGAIAGEVTAVHRTATPLQERLNRLARIVGILVCLFALATFVLGILTGRSASEMFLIAVALAVSAVPEGLPIAFTITLAVGVRRMAHRNAIVRHLPSVETLGSATVIGSDKTGTLTENMMSVQRVWSAGRTLHLSGSWDGLEPDIAWPDELEEHYANPHYLTLLTGVLTNEARVSLSSDGIQIQGDPTEAAMLIAAMRLGIEPDAMQEAFAITAEIPFEPHHQFSASLRTHGDERQLFVKGAPERVLAMCEMTLNARGDIVPIDREMILDAAHEMAAAGLRVLAMANSDQLAAPLKAQDLEDPKALTFLGLQGLADPPRGGARDAIAACRQAGIRVLMITGDHAATARAIGHELGINHEHAAVLTGSDLETLSDAELDEGVAKVDIFARVEPAQKLRIVRLLQRQGEVVAVTGDGVNDAPALRAADIGIAMGRRGTDVAKEAADMVLADDNFVSIAAAVEEGRITFANVRKVVFFLFSANGAEVITIIGALALGWPLPLLAAQILWLNLVTDTLPVIALAFEPGGPGVMKRPPTGRHAGILSRVLWERLGLSSVVMTIGTLALFRWELDRTGSETAAQSLALTTMVLFQMFQAINARSETRSIFRLNPFSNRFLFLAIAISIALQVAVLNIDATQRLLRIESIGAGPWLIAVLVASSVLVAVELHKVVRRQT